LQPPWEIGQPFHPPHVSKPRTWSAKARVTRLRRYFKTFMSLKIRIIVSCPKNESYIYGHFFHVKYDSGFEDAKK